MNPQMEELKKILETEQLIYHSMDGSIVLRSTVDADDILDVIKIVHNRAITMASESIISDAIETYGSDIPDCWSMESITKHLI